MKKYSILFIAIFVILLVMPGLAGAWDGAGTESDPWLIRTEADLVAIRSGVNAATSANQNYNSGGTTNYAAYLGQYFRVENDIALTATNWAPIGTTGSATTVRTFAGIFDGNNNTISSLTISSGPDSSGLFGRFAGIVKNLNVSGNVAGSAQAVGGIVGRMLPYGQNAYMDNCTFSGTVSGSDNAVGGLIGQIGVGYQMTTFARVTNCTNYAMVTGSRNGTGGVAGETGAFASSTAYPMISNCQNRGQVSATGTYSGYGEYVGGIVGNLQSYSRVDVCVNYADVLVTANNAGSYTSAGGIAGQTSSTNTVSNSQNLGNVSSASTGPIYLGGIVGYNTASSIYNCFNVGQVTSTGASGNRYAGGIAGMNTSSNAGFVIANCYNLGVLSGGTARGGVVGRHESTNAAVTNSYFQLGKGATPAVGSYAAGTRTSLGSFPGGGTFPNVAGAITASDSTLLANGSNLQAALNAYVTANSALNLSPWKVERLTNGGFPVLGIQKYDVLYDANGGTGTTADPMSPYTPNASTLVLSSAFTRDGYTFENWNSQPDGLGTPYLSGAPLTVTADLLLYAQWKLMPKNPTLFITEAMVDFGDNDGTADGSIFFNTTDVDFSDPLNLALWISRDGATPVKIESATFGDAGSGSSAAKVATYSVNPAPKATYYDYYLEYFDGTFTYRSNTVHVTKPLEGTGSTAAVVPANIDKPSEDSSFSNVTVTTGTQGGTSNDAVTVADITVPKEVKAQLDTLGITIGSIVVTADSMPQGREVKLQSAGPVVGLALFDTSGNKITERLTEYVSYTIPYVSGAAEKDIAIYYRHSEGTASTVREVLLNADDGRGFKYAKGSNGAFVFSTKIFSEVEQYNTTLVITSASSAWTIIALVLVALGSAAAAGRKVTKN